MNTAAHRDMRAAGNQGAYPALSNRKL